MAVLDKLATSDWRVTRGEGVWFELVKVGPETRNTEQLLVHVVKSVLLHCVRAHFFVFRLAYVLLSEITNKAIDRKKHTS